MSSAEIHANIEKGEAIKCRNIGFWNSLALLKEQARDRKIFRYVVCRSAFTLLTFIITYFLIKIKPIGSGTDRGIWYFFLV